LVLLSPITFHQTNIVQHFANSKSVISLGSNGDGDDDDDDDDDDDGDDKMMIDAQGVHGTKVSRG